MCPSHKSETDENPIPNRSSLHDLMGKDRSHPEHRDRVKDHGEELEELKSIVHERAVTAIDRDLIRKEENSQLRKKLESQIEDLIIRVAGQEGISLSSQEEHALIDDVIDEILGLGPLEPLIKRDDITEIMVNGSDKVYIEKDGDIQLTDIQFHDEDHLMNIIHEIVAPLGRRIDQKKPYVDARLPDGSRVNVIIPPLVDEGPMVTIRKFKDDPYTIDDLIDFGTLNGDMEQFFERCVKGKSNIIVSGGTGSGKTTTLNCLSRFIPDGERIITIEDTKELKLQQEHVIQCESRPPNVEGEGEITIRELVKNSLRMRPDRIIVGECRGGEAFDMLQAMNTGHEGSMTTIHANSPRDVLYRLENLVLMAEMKLPESSIRKLISSAIDLIVHQDRLFDGSRRITSVQEITGMENDRIQLSEIFSFRYEERTEEEVKGKHVPTGVVPNVVEDLENKKLDVSRDIFRTSD
ncbi:MAG: CpaF family protein [bacterium]